MDLKESESAEVFDDSFLKKYIRDDNTEKEKESESNFLKARFETKNSGATEVLNTSGESYDYSDNSNNNSFKKKSYGGNSKSNNDDEESFEIGLEAQDNIRVESSSKPLSEAKKEFLDQLEDEALTLDTCDKINKDYSRKS